MPECKNDPKANYKGNEPSPKGLGYCAHSEKLGTIKKGKDGNKWIISKTQLNIKRWNKLNQTKKTSKINSKKTYKINSKKTSKKNSKINSKKTSKKTSKIKGKKYYVHDNWGRPFEVIINKNIVHVYKITNHELNIYDKLIKTFNNVKKVHIGKFDKDKYFNGNTILLELYNNKFICIMSDIFEFELKTDDEFIKYFSEVGNSDVAYPVLLGKKYFYSMIEKIYTKIDSFPSNYKIKDFEKAHNFYYRTFTEKKKLPKLKIIHKKIYWTY